jgi:hypothetical protein
VTVEDMRLVLRRLVDEFEGSDRGMTEREVRAYTRHLQSLPASVVNAAIDAIVERGVYTRPVPGGVLRAAPGLSATRAALLEQRADAERWREHWKELLARKPGDELQRAALRHAVDTCDELIAEATS